MTSGTVSRVEPHAILSDFRLASGSSGGPVFTAGGGVATVAMQNPNLGTLHVVAHCIKPEPCEKHKAPEPPPIAERGN